MQITVKIEDKKVRQGVHNIGEAIPRIGKRRVKQAMDGAKADASGQFPRGSFSGYTVAPPAGSTYTRTGRYGKSFQVAATDSGMGYKLSSDAIYKGNHYSVYVGGNAQGQGQAAIHARRGGWALIKDAVDKWVAILIREVKADLSQIVRGEGMGM